jgi:enolase
MQFQWKLHGSGTINGARRKAVKAMKKSVPQAESGVPQAEEELDGKSVSQQVEEALQTIAKAATETPTEQKQEVEEALDFLRGFYRYKLKVDEWSGKERVEDSWEGFMKFVAELFEKGPHGVFADIEEHDGEEEENKVPQAEQVPDIDKMD